MKDYINYFYNFNPDSIFLKKGNYYFNYNDKNYCLYLIENINVINKEYRLYEYVKNYFLLDEIIYTKFNKLYIFYNNNYYVLLKLISRNNINLNDILEFNLEIINYDNKQWKLLWCKKIDYIENLLVNYDNELYFIKESVNYYIGLAENAISICNQINLNSRYFIVHKRIENYFNPFNLIIDLRFRDVCEYFKKQFFDEINIEYELNYYLSNNNLNFDEKLAFLARMLFPTYYFDALEEYLKTKDTHKLKKITHLASDFEKILHKIYIEFKCNIYIEWLE